MSDLVLVLVHFALLLFPDTLQALVQRVNNVDTASDSSDQCPVPQKPQLNETEKVCI